MAFSSPFDVPPAESDDESMAPVAFDPYATEEVEQMMNIRDIDSQAYDMSHEDERAAFTTTFGRVVMATVAVGAFVGVAGSTGAGSSMAAAVGMSSSSALSSKLGVGTGEGFCTVPTADDDSTTTYFKCPPGAYLNNTAETKKKKMERLMALQAKLKDMGYVENTRSAYKAEYAERGYATYESPVWLKPEECSTLPDEEWTAENNEWYYQYQPDHAPSYITKQVFQDYALEFHDNWKVASTSFSSYLPCEYGSFDKVNEDTAVPDGYMTAAPVRYPVSRFVSAVGELMERSMNHYCPSGYCQSSDAYDNETLWKLTHQTTWYPTMCNETKLVYNETAGHWMTVPSCTFDEDKFPEVVRAFVHDKKCNYYFYAAEHFVSQSAFVTQNDGCAADLDTVIRLEELDDGLAELAEKVGKVQSCDMGDSNSASNKPGGLPSESATMAILKQIPDLMKDICMIYAQDFICYDYELPSECEGLF